MAALLVLLARRGLLSGTGAGGQVVELAWARGVSRAADPAAEHPLFSRLFSIARRPWPLAALTREHDCGDAKGHAWVRADPAHMRPDIAGAQLLAAGNLALDRETVDALRRSLAPMFGDLGWILSTPHPDRWYLQLPLGATLPAMAPPWQAIGCDPRAHWPQGPDAARWIRLLNECQMLLHAHPLNAVRVGRGLPAVNSLWFWGAGSSADAVQCAVNAIASTDPLLLALAAAAGVPAAPALPAATRGDRLLDLRAERDPAVLERDWLLPAWRDLRAGRIDALQLMFADGESVRVGRAGSFAFWRRSRTVQ
jgi:hypothetical protein